MLLAEIIDPKINEKVLDTSCGTGGFLTICIEHLKKKAKNVSDYEKNATYLLLIWGTLQGTASPTPPLNGHNC